MLVSLEHDWPCGLFLSLSLPTSSPSPSRALSWLSPAALGRSLSGDICQGCVTRRERARGGGATKSRRETQVQPRCPPGSRTNSAKPIINQFQHTDTSHELAARRRGSGGGGAVLGNGGGGHAQFAFARARLANAKCLRTLPKPVVPSLWHWPPVCLSWPQRGRRGTPTDGVGSLHAARRPAPETPWPGHAVAGTRRNRKSLGKRTRRAAGWPAPPVSRGGKHTIGKESLPKPFRLGRIV